jgi:uncharacterized protein (TIGR00266 family)
MKHEVRYSPSFSLLEVELKPGEQLIAEAGAMVYIEGDVNIQTRSRQQGLFKKLKVSMMGGESFFINEFVARSPAKVGLASSPLGDIVRLEAGPGKGYIMQSGAYVASSPQVTLDTQWQGFTKGLFGHGLFMLKVGGMGELFLNSFGALDRHVLQPGQSMTVDNFHLVAFSDMCKYEVTKFGGLKSTILGGEGLVTKVHGPGEIYIQTKNIQEFVGWLAPFLPEQRNR